MLIPFGHVFPSLAEGVWVAPNAIITGDVTIGVGSSIWFQSVVRGDESAIHIGRETNVQDACILHTQSRNGLVIGDRVSVGHMAVLHGCEIRDGALIGIGSVVLDGAVIGRNCIVGAGSLVTPNARFEDEQVILGRPAKAVRAVTAAEVEENEQRAQRYLRNAAIYAAGGRAPRGGGP
jgi:carbonic anhydrase/acetyltransferase-like protein (isoleucine patch superfamily)